MSYFEGADDVVTVKIKLSTSNVEKARIMEVHYLSARSGMDYYSYDSGEFTHKCFGPLTLININLDSPDCPAYQAKLPSK